MWPLNGWPWFAPDGCMAGETKALLVAAELARHIGRCGTGEMPSAPDLARSSGLTEDNAILAVHALIYRGFVALIYRPRIAFTVRFFCRPGPHQNAMIQKKPVT